MLHQGHYAVVATHPAQLQNLNFWNDFAKGFERGFTTTANIANRVAQVGVPIFQDMVGHDSRYSQYADAAAQAADATKRFSDGVFPGHLMLVNLEDLEDEELQQLNFWNDFTKGFKKGFTTTANIAKKVADVGVPIFKDMVGKDSKYSGYADAASQAADATKKFSDGVYAQQLMMLQAQAGQPELQNLNFWNDFGKGFKKGFGMVMSPAAKIAGMLGPEGAAAGKAFSGINGAVQGLVPGRLMNLNQQQIPYDTQLIY